MGAGGESTQKGFALGERLLNRREVGLVGRQEQQLAAAHHDHPRWVMGRPELLRDVPFERAGPQATFVMCRPLEGVDEWGGERRYPLYLGLSIISNANAYRPPSGPVASMVQPQHKPLRRVLFSSTSQSRYTYTSPTA